MKRQLFAVLVCMTMFAVTSCGEKKGKDKFEERIEIAKESQPVRVAKSITSSGLVYVVLCRYFILYTSQYAKFAFYCNIELVSILNNLLCQSNIFFIWKM